MNQRNEPTLLLVDGMAVLFRAFYATSASGYIRRTKAGLPTNAVYGFIRYFWDAVQTLGQVMSYVVGIWAVRRSAVKNMQPTKATGPKLRMT